MLYTKTLLNDKANTQSLEKMLLNLKQCGYSVLWVLRFGDLTQPWDRVRMTVLLKYKLLNRRMPRCCVVHGCVEVFVLYVRD